MSSARTVFPRQRERERAIACGAEQPRRTGWPEIVLIVRTGRPSLQSVAGRVYPGVSIRLVPRRANSDFNSIFRSPLADVDSAPRHAKGMSISELGDISHSPPCRADGRNDTRCNGFQHVRLAPGHSTPSTWHNMMRRKSSRTRHRQQEFVFQIAVYIYLIIIIYHSICLLLCFFRL